MKKLKSSQIFFLITVAIILALVNIIHVILGSAKTLPGFTYLGVGHFYTDYFEYLQQIVQGARGRWTVINQFTADDPTKTILGWGVYLLIGKFGAIFKFTPVFTYWLSIFILGFFLSLVIFSIVKRLLAGYSFMQQFLAFVLTLSIAPFVKIISEAGKINIIPFDFWYAPISFFHRFGGAPHHLLGSILTILAIIMAAELLENNEKLKITNYIAKAVVFVILVILLLTFMPFQSVSVLSAVFFVGCLTIWFWLFKAREDKQITRKFFFLLITAIIILPLALLIKFSHDQSSLFVRAIEWEKTQQLHPPLLLVLGTIGPILFAIPFGIREYFKKIDFLRLIVFVYFLFSYFYFFSPLAQILGTFNLRFLTPVAYIFYGTAGFMGIINFSKKIRQKWVFKIIIFVFFVYGFLINGFIFSSFTLDRLSYMPSEVMAAFKFLDQKKDARSVLTSPPMSLGVILPSYADHNVYLGRTIFTPDFEFRSAVSHKFYLGSMTKEEAQLFLKEHNIGYILLTSIEGYMEENLSKYELKEIYRNKKAIIWSSY